MEWQKTLENELTTILEAADDVGAASCQSFETCPRPPKMTGHLYPQLGDLPLLASVIATNKASQFSLLIVAAPLHALDHVIITKAVLHMMPVVFLMSRI